MNRVDFRCLTLLSDTAYSFVEGIFADCPSCQFAIGFA